MVTIDNTQFTSDINLASVYGCMTKQRMLDIVKKLDLYVSPNLKKEETARRVAQEVLDNPVSVLSSLCKAEHQLLAEFIEAGADAYIVRKMRKTPYKLQKFGLVLTYQDWEKNQWHMLMPNSVREALSVLAPQYMDIINAGRPIPTAKEIRIGMAMRRFMGLDEEEK